jgi:hypothetical protein
MTLEALIKRVKRSLNKDGLTLVTTRRDSRDFWQMGRYAVIDYTRVLVEADADLSKLAGQRGLIHHSEHDNISTF